MQQADMANAVPRVKRKHIYANTLKTEKARTTERQKFPLGRGTVEQEKINPRPVMTSKGIWIVLYRYKLEQL